MDILDDILDTLSLKGALYFRTDFSSPWSVEVPDLADAARFHLVVQGNCHVQLPDGEGAHIGPGDMVLIPGGSSHVLADCPTSNAPKLDDVLKNVSYDGKGVLVLGKGDHHAATKMICGHFTFRNGADHPLLAALPKYMVTSASDRAQNPGLDEILRLLTQRVFADQTRSTATVIRLSEVVFIELLSAGINQCPELQMVLDAFNDKQVGSALKLIHEKPDHPWSVEKLAVEVGMSRSRFADRFASLIGTGPMSYVSDWRLQKALALLDDGMTSIQEVAKQTGYQSAAAFTRAFGTKFGISPKEYRKSA